MSRMDYIADPVAQLLALLPAPGQPRVVVGLVGLPGAGKSTQAQAWARRVNAQAGAGVVQAVGMDGFHLRLAELAQLPPPHNELLRRGAPWTFDAAKLARSLQALHLQDGADSPATVHWPAFDHAVGEPVEQAIAIDPATRLVLVEGLYLLLPEPPWQLQGLMHPVWFLDEDMDTAMQRLVQRHCLSWDLSEAEALARIARNDRLNAEIADQTRSLAHALVAPVALDDFQPLLQDTA